jgi:hypothetical protein
MLIIHRHRIVGQKWRPGAAARRQNQIQADGQRDGLDGVVHKVFGDFSWLTSRFSIHKVLREMALMSRIVHPLGAPLPKPLDSAFHEANDTHLMIRLDTGC